MTLSRGSRRRLLAVPLGVLMVGLALPASGQSAPSDDPFANAAPWEEYGFQGEGEARVRDLDLREGVVPPSQAAREIAERLGATNPRWNAFGTPRVLVNLAGERGGRLAGPREGAAADVARAFVRENAALFRLDEARVDALEMVKDAPLYDSPDLARAYGAVDEPVANPDVAHVVTFRQKFGDLEAALEGLLTVGVQKDGSIVWVNSSVTGDSALSNEQRVAPADAVQAAASDVELDLGTLSAGPVDGRYMTFVSDVAKDVQRARLVALPTPTDGVRRAWEVTLLDTQLDKYGNPTAFISYVDAENATILYRSNKLDHFAQGTPGGAVTLPTAGLPSAQVPSGGAYEGTTAAGGCGPLHEFEVPAGTGQITTTAQSPENPNTDTVTADLVATIVYQGETVATGDTLGNPEAATYSPPEDTLPGTYAAQVCNFSSADPAFNYTGNFFLTPVGVGGGEEGGAGGPLVDLPTWRVFPANPPFVAGRQPEDTESPETRELWCWDIGRFGDCAEEQRNIAARTPWDVNGTSTPSFTTDGNFASTAISEASFLTPDSALNRPTSQTREYDYPWGNKWFESSCDPTNFGTVADDRNDEQASTANLFAMHNRMHDWSYFLGFTEVNSNLQKTNFGNTGPERENDPELGSSQAGRRTFNGRDNANQITLGDGIPGITNQYLWQPLAGAFYAPCVDGAYDMAVVAHEYGHAISNRMIGGSDGPLGGTGATQGQTESWSDMLFAAYFTEFAISAGEGVNPYVLGPYVTGDPVAGIRNFPMNDSPLNYSNLDYDPSGLGSPHANGEIYSAVNFDILRSLNTKYDAEFPSSDAVLQNRCARGELGADDCPGNRRWNQIQFDSFLIQPSGATMVDSRDAMLAADMLRFDGENQTDLWSAFAKRGLGENASAEDAADVDSVPSFESPKRDDEAQVRFTAPAGVTDMKVHVGRFESNTVPIADTVADTETGDTAGFVPGQYEFIATAPGFGAQRFTLDLTRGQRTVEVPLRRNQASAASGASITGDGVNLDKLIDDTESTNWASVESAGTASEGKEEGAQVEGRQVVVDLAGDAPVDVREVQVSAALRPNNPVSEEEDEELPTDPDPGNQSRFSALRSFDLFSCNAAAGADCSKAESFTQIFASPDDAFPSTRPRPRIPDFLVRPFDVTDTQATHVKLVVRDSQCTGGPDFQGENNPDNDPLFNPDCDFEGFSPDREVLSPPIEQVRAAELQVFSQPSTPVGTPVAPVARNIGPACPDDVVPRNSRQDIKGNTHERAIDCMIWYEIAKGTSDKLYEPRMNVSRAQMASFVARLIRQGGGTLPEGDPNRFTDVKGNIHEANINALAAAGVVDGKGDGRYDPDGTVSRAQMAKFLVQGYQYRAQRNLPAPRTDYFPDDNGNVHEVNIKKSAEAGFTVGLADGRYDPSGDVRRDQMASFLARMLTLLVEEGITKPKQ